jgi:hypothetical protein
MDRHEVPGASAEDVAEAHVSDLTVAPEFGVKFFSYWFDEDDGAVFCFARAPDEETMTTVHERSHGILPAEIIRVSEDDVVSFLGNVHDPADASDVTSPFRIVAFTDLVDSTALLNQVGQAEFLVLLSEHDLILRKALARGSGREVKHTGDGIMVSFPDPGAALEWSLDVRDIFARRTDMSIRIGLAAGEPVAHHRDLFGPAVNLANRICAAAGAGRVFVSDLVHDLGVKDGYFFGEPAQAELKGFPGIQTIYELRGRS